MNLASGQPHAQKASTVLVIEDHVLYRDAVAELARSSLAPDTSVFAFSSAELALKACPDLADVGMVLLDQDLPGMSGLDAMPHLRRCAPSASMIVLSGSSDPQSIAGAAAGGACAFASKTAPTGELAELLKRVAAGSNMAFETLLDCELIQAPLSPLPQLSGRQRDVLRLVADGRPNREIGRRLGLTEITVRVHVSAILRRLQVKNRTQACILARRIGLLQ
jgi:two-component system nitrate/nitrite response regulator NarL